MTDHDAGVRLAAFVVCQRVDLDAKGLPRNALGVAPKSVAPSLPALISLDALIGVWSGSSTGRRGFQIRAVVDGKRTIVAKGELVLEPEKTSAQVQGFRVTAHAYGGFLVELWLGDEVLARTPHYVVPA